MSESTIRKCFTLALGISCALTVLLSDADGRHRARKANKLPVKVVARHPGAIPTPPISPLLVKTVSFRPGPVRDDPKPTPQPFVNAPVKADRWLHSDAGKRFSLLIIGTVCAFAVWHVFKPEGRTA